ncbi:phage tail protein I [Paraneptunicella aestuarii]|uniref:phage tail protein I n=1 Tax=Paraneptunicella aestuarii TaxID=2831148 RepID=UPI001E2CAF30|nr:phage tail protein I [Paraneptunicella aestuarii]UAA38216.1 phage tail protein I [Paraneptunicella aestuarii]
MSSSILPPNATTQEQAMELSIAGLSEAKINIKDLWNPETCPPEFLPWLAWAFSIDNWSPDWPEAQKRLAIQDSFKLHQKKGTIGAVKDALSTMSINTEIAEWWETGDQAGTFKVSALVSQQGIDNELIQEIGNAVEANKRLSAHYTLSLTLNSETDTRYLLGSFGASIATVEPYSLRELNSDADFTYITASMGALVATVEAIP